MPTKKRSVKRTAYVEPFSMVTRRATRNVSTRHENGEEVPCVNVKVPPLYHRLPVDVRDQDPDSSIFNMTAEQWWDLVPQELAEFCFKSAFKGKHPRVFSAGRSSGWCCVSGIGEPSEWNAKQRAAWARFEKGIKASMKDAEQNYIEDIRANM